MPPMNVIDFLKSQREIKKELALQCAPLFKGLKESNIITASIAEAKEFKCSLADTEISVFTLYEGEKNSILFLYRREELRMHLEKNEVNNFLFKFGYRENDLDAMLSRLAGQFSEFYGKQKEFPHEIGAFLGYPMEDVIGFIKYRGMNYLLCGYWKVYGDVIRARAMFERYDLAKAEVVNDLLGGKSLHDLISKKSEIQDRNFKNQAMEFKFVMNA